MSEDTSAKRADRRRRTTRAGRRKPPRMPAGVAGDSWPPPSWPPEAGAEGALDAGGDGAGAELDGAEEALDGVEGLELEPIGDEDDDARATSELHVTPLLTTPPPPAPEEDEKTNPRVRLDELAGAAAAGARDLDNAPTHPQIRAAELSGEAVPEGRTSSVVISRAHIISDAPPPPRTRVAPVAPPAVAAPKIPAEARLPPRPLSAPLGVEPPPAAAGAFGPDAVLPADPEPGAAPPLEVVASEATTRPDTAAASRWIELAARELAAENAAAAAATTPAAVAVPDPVAAPPAPVAVAFEEFQSSEPPAPVVIETEAATEPAQSRAEASAAAVVSGSEAAAPNQPTPMPEEAAASPALPELDDGALQLVDVEDAEPEAGSRVVSRVPPPPPPVGARTEAQPLPAPRPSDAAARAKPPPPVAARVDAPPAPKRPPPPPAPAANKVDEDRQKRKQVRQWWERFFSDDYLMTVLPPTPAQISRQVDFVEQSLGLSKGATLLDVGCGLGLHSIELTRRGYLVVGLDLSLAMITRAAEASQEQGLKINFVHADIREMEFDGAFDGIVCMGTTFGFFDDEANRDVLARLHHALRPGGRMLLELVNRDYVVGLQPNLVWFEGDDCVCMEESDFNYFNSRLSVKRTMMREDGRQSNAEYSLRLYSLHELGLVVQQLGFRVIEVSGQEAIRGAFFGSDSPRILMLAERRTPARGTATAQMEPTRPSLAFPAERSSTDLPKPKGE